MNSNLLLASSCQFNSLVCPTSILALKFKYSTEVRQQVDIIFDKSLCEFYKWFVGFTDAEWSFWILPVLNTNNGIEKITFVFSIELDKDDFKVLKYIQEKLGIGNIIINKDKCVFTVTNIEGRYHLISIFDKYNINSTKYLNYFNFRKAFMIYPPPSLLLLGCLPINL